jgi:EamA-like transporter family
VDVDLDVDYATTLLAAVLLGIGFVLQQYSAEQEPDSRFLSLRILTDLLRKPRWLLGIVCMVLGYLLAAWSIGHLELTLVEPLLTTYLVWALILAVPLSRQPVRATEVVGALILCLGVALLSASRSTTPIGLSFGSFSHWYAAAIIAGVAFIAVQTGHRRQGQVRATLTGLGAGLVFGIQDALTRQTLQILQGSSSWTVLFSTWSAYALVGAGIVGIWLMQNAFSAAPLHASLPAIAAGEPIAGIALGIVVFGDRIQISPGQLAIEAGGIAALIVGVVMVARSSAFGGLRKITGAIKPGSDHVSPLTPDGAAEPGTPDGAAEPGTLDGAAQPGARDSAGRPRIPDGTDRLRTPDGTVEPSARDGTGRPGTPHGAAEPSARDGTGRPGAPDVGPRSPDGSVDRKLPGGLDPRTARKLSRPAHRRQVHDSPSGGEVG